MNINNNLKESNSHIFEERFNARVGDIYSYKREATVPADYYIVARINIGNDLRLINLESGNVWSFNNLFGNHDIKFPERWEKVTNKVELNLIK